MSNNQKFCSSCGTELESDSRFCPGCGQPVDGSTAPGVEQPKISAPLLTSEWRLPSWLMLILGLLMAGALCAGLYALGIGRQPKRTQLTPQQEAEIARRVIDDLPEQRQIDLDRATNPKDLPENVQKKFNQSGLSAAHRSEIARAFGPTNAPTYTDDFSDPASGWKTATDKKAIREYRDGHLSITFLADTGTAQISLPHTFGNFAVEMEVMPVTDASADDCYFGLAVRKSQKEKFIAFLINDQGRYAIVSRDGQANSILVKPQKSAAIKPGMATNKIKVYAMDDLFLLEVNGTVIDSVNVDNFAPGDVAVALSRGRNVTQKSAQVFYDNFKLWDLGK